MTGITGVPYSSSFAVPTSLTVATTVSTKEAGKAGLKRSSSSSSVELAVSSSQGPTVLNSASSACDDGSTVLGTVAQFQTPFQRRETASLRSSKLSAFSPDPASMLAAGRSKDRRPRSREFVKDMVGPLVSKVCVDLHTQILDVGFLNSEFDFRPRSPAIRVRIRCLISAARVQL